MQPAERPSSGAGRRFQQTVRTAQAHEYARLMDQDSQMEEELARVRARTLEWEEERRQAEAIRAGQARPSTPETETPRSGGGWASAVGRTSRAQPQPEPEPESQALILADATPIAERSFSYAEPEPEPEGEKQFHKVATTAATVHKARKKLAPKPEPPKSRSLMSRKAMQVHDVAAHSPKWSERGDYKKKVKQQKAAEVEAERLAELAKKQAKQKAKQNSGPMTEKVKDEGKFRYGQIYFEETGNTVPYIIAPEGVQDAAAREEAAKKLLTAMVKNMRHNGEKLGKPNITFDISGHGTHYLEWAKEIYDNDELAAAWGWHHAHEKEELVDAALCIQAVQRGRRSRRDVRFAQQTCTNAAMALVIECQVSKAAWEAEDEAGTTSAFRAKNEALMDAAEERCVRPLDRKVGELEWKLDGVFVEPTSANPHGWTRGTAKAALTEMSRGKNKSKKVQFKWRVKAVAARTGPRVKAGSFSAKFSTGEHAAAWLGYQGATLSTLKEYAADLKIDQSLVEFYTSVDACCFQCVRDDRPYILKNLLRNYERPKGSKRGSEDWGWVQNPRGKGLLDFAREFETSKGSGRTVAALTGGLIKQASDASKRDGGDEDEHGLEREMETKFSTECLGTRAERLLSPETYGLPKPTRPPLCIRGDEDEDVRWVPQPQPISRSTKIAEWDKDDPAAFKKKLIEEILKLEENRIKRINRVRTERLEEIDWFAGMTGAEDDDVADEYVQSSQSIQGRCADIQAKVVKGKIKEPAQALMDAVALVNEVLQYPGLATEKSILPLVKLVTDVVALGGHGQLNDGGFSEIKTLISAWKKELQADEADQIPREERRLRIPERWTERFKTIMRGEPYKAALLGLPLDMDDNSYERLAHTIQYDVELPVDFWEPVDAEWKKLEEPKLGQPLEEEDPAAALLTKYHVGPKSYARVKMKKHKDLPDEDTNRIWQEDWGHREDAYEAYKEWWKCNSIDVDKVKHYFSCRQTEGSLESMKAEMESMLEKLSHGHLWWQVDASEQDEHGWRRGRARTKALDAAIREFGDRMLRVFSNVAQGVVNSDGWLFGPAGRHPPQQLIGETIERYSKDLENLVFVQYAALKNPRLGGAQNHRAFVEQLRASSVELNEDMKRPPGELGSHVFYPSNRVLYPTADDVQGLCTDDDGNRQHVQDWLEEKAQIIEEQLGDVHLHPAATHLIFWDTEGYASKSVGSRPFEQPLPHDNINALKEVLRGEGVAEGLLMVNGDELDFDRGRKQVAHSEPVLCLKGVGGAADFMSQIFDRRRDEKEARDAQDDTLRLEMAERKSKQEELEKASRGVMGTRHLKAQAEKYDLELGDIENTESAIQDIVDAYIFKYREKQKKQNQQQHRRHGRHRHQLGGMQSAGDEDQDPKLKDAAIHKTFRNGRYTFEPREVCDQREMITINVTPANENTDGIHGLYTARPLTAALQTNRRQSAGDNIQRQLAEMLSMQGDERERVLGFSASEHRRISTAWDQSIHYYTNGAQSEFWSRVVQYAMLIINLLLVAVVVLKQAKYPDTHAHHRAGCGGDTRTASQRARQAEILNPDDEFLLTCFKIALMVMPIVNGIFLTLDNAFAPTKKRNALLWTAEKLESELYQYRARACKYSPVNTNLRWSFINAGNEGNEGEISQQGAKMASQIFVEEVNKVIAVLRADGVFVKSHLNYVHEEEDIDERRKVKIKELKSQELWVIGEDVNKQTEDKRPTRTRFEDTGYSPLDAAQYIACRTQPLLARQKKRLPWMGRLDMFFNTAIFVVTTISVILGSLRLDLYIAISTAAVSFLLGFLEFEKYEETVHRLNRSTQDLEEKLLWWDGLTFVQRRTAKNKDIIVKATEKAVMAERNLYYQGGADLSEDGTEPAAGGDSGGARTG